MLERLLAADLRVADATFSVHVSAGKVKHPSNVVYLQVGWRLLGHGHEEWSFWNLISLILAHSNC